MDSFYNNHLYWGLDPLFHSHVKLLNCMLLRFTKPTNHATNSVAFYRFAPHLPPRPLRLVHIAGIIVFLAHHSKFSRYLVDDGSSVARCLLWNDDANPSFSMSLGDFVDVQGRIDWQHGVPLVVVTHQHAPSWPYGELSWWVEVQEAHRNVYSEPLDIVIVPDDSQASEPPW